MSKFNNFIKENKIIFIVASIIILIGSILMLLYFNFYKKELKEQTYSNTYYSIKYDTTWEINNSTKDNVTLKHNSDSTLEISIINLDEEYKYENIETINEDVIYNTTKQNPNYKLLAKEKVNITKNKYSGYKVLYENGEDQALVLFAKCDDKLLLITFNASNNYFDILLDSIHNIIYNIEVKNEKIDIKYESKKLNTQKINWEKNENLNKSLKENTKYKVASHNYLVEFSIPDNFKLHQFDTESKLFRYQNDDTFKEGSITLSVGIDSNSLYYHLTNEEGMNSIVKYAKKNPETYKNFKQTLTKIPNSKVNTYILKYSYDYDGTIYKNQKYETIYFIYELSNKRSFIINIETHNTKITKELIDKINFISSTKYGEYIYRNFEDNLLVNEMKYKFNEFKENKEFYYDVKIKLPRKYYEIDKETNLYEQRNFGTDYNEDEGKYKQRVFYYLGTLDMYQETSGINYADYTEIKNLGSVNLNGKKFNKYIGKYVYKRKSYEDIILVYPLKDKHNLTITLNNENKKIADETLKEVSNFDVEIKEYK